jgi:hypothetical protein
LVRADRRADLVQDLTVVTGIWDLGRDRAGEGFARSFDHYKTKFAELLASDVPMLVYGDPTLREFVEEQRGDRPTDFREYPADAFRTRFDFYAKVQAIRTRPDWAAQAEWLARSPQATLELYNPMVMSKMFLLHDAAVWNPFGTAQFAWIDGAITNTVHPGYFTHDRVFDRVGALLERFLFVSFPYTDGPEIHGFPRPGMQRFAGADPQWVCRGGFFGGHRAVLSEANGHYYSLLSATLHEGLMGTEESVFTLMAMESPELYDRFALKDEHHGLLQHFFEHVKALPLRVPRSRAGALSHRRAPQPGPAGRPERRRALQRELPARSIAGYIVTFNAPVQLERTVTGWVSGFTFDTLYILDHSTDEAARAANRAFAERVGATLLSHPKGNGGISGGRQFVAEHFAASAHDYYVFIEDDMLLNDAAAAPVCRNGFRSTVPQLRETLLHIMELEEFDFLKLSFTEFFGENRTQFAWYNVPGAVRAEVWPDQTKLPRHGLDPDSPPTCFDTIGTVNGVSYATGEVYYCNWPQIVSRAGNQRMFLDTVFEHPSEHAWMSLMFQRTLAGELRPAVLLASPITHDRFHHYPATERREN